MNATLTPAAVKPTSIAEKVTAFLASRGYSPETIERSRRDPLAIDPADADAVQAIVAGASAPDPAVPARNARTALVFSLMYGRDVSTGNTQERIVAASFGDHPSEMPPWLALKYREALLAGETPKAWAAVRFGEACWLSDRPADAGDVEGDPSTWPAWTDEDIWETTEWTPEPEPFHPDPAEEAWAAALFRASLARIEAEDLDWLATHSRAVDALCNALVPADLPFPSDRRPDARPVKVRGPRPAMAPVSDYDRSLTGAV